MATLDFLTPLSGPGSDENESQMDMFLRTGSPVADPANELQEGQVPSFLTPAEPEVEPYNWTAAGMPLPETLRPVGDLVAGLNSALADVAGIATTDVDFIMRNLGMGGFLDKPGDGKKAIVEQFEKLGIAADKRKAVNQFLADIGEGAGQNLLLLSAFMAAAPGMMAAQGPGMMANLQRQLGTGMITNPGAAISAEVAAAAGAETGERIAPAGHETLGGVAGALMGGAIPSAVGSLVGMTGIPSVIGGVKSGISDVRQAVKTGRQAIGTTPLLTEEAPNVRLVSDAIKGDQMRVDAIIDKLSTKMTQSADPIESARALQEVQRNAYSRVREVEDTYWGKVDMKRKLPTDSLKQWRSAIIKSTVPEGRAEWLPNDLLSGIDKLPKVVTMDRLRAIRTLAFQRLQAGTVATPAGVLPVNDKLRANLNGLIDAVDNQIGSAFPNDVELQKAAGFTKWLHDRFTRGPVARFAQPRADESQLGNVRNAARTAVSDPRFGPQTQDISRVLADEGASMPALEVAAEQFMRGQLSEEVARLGPEAAAKFMKQPSTKSFLKAYPKLSAEFTATTDRLTKAMAFKRDVMNSSFVRLMNEQPESAIRSLIGSKSAVRDAANLMKRIRTNPEALEATKNQYLISLEQAAGSDPNKILTMLQGNDTGRVARIILGDDVTRLERIARDASSRMETDNGIPRWILRKGGRVVGSYFGRKLNTGTLQAPEFGGKLAERLMSDFLGKVDGEIFSKAVRYPAFEAILNARKPQSLAGVNHLKTLIRRAIRVEEAAERATAPLLNGDNEE